MLDTIPCHAILWYCPWWRVTYAVKKLVLSYCVMMVGLKEVSFYSPLRIHRQYGEKQEPIKYWHLGYTCPWSPRVVERIEDEWHNQAVYWRISAPKVISPSGSYYTWLAADMEREVEAEETYKRKRDAEDEEGASKRAKDDST